MKYAYLGRSNLQVSRICLGTMHFGRLTPEDESFRIMDRALELGINFFDTANVYGGTPGRTEEIIGRWFAQGGGRRDKVALATKVYGRMSAENWPNAERGLSAFKVRDHAAGSLARLQTDHIDLYQVHHVDRHISADEFWGALGRLVDSGEVLYVGTSNFPGWGLAKFQSAAVHRGRLGIVSEQTMYNLLNRIPELEVLPAARDFGIGILPYMPLAGGILTGKQQSEPGSRTQQVEQEYGVPVSRNRQLELFTGLCRELGEQESVVAIAWTLAHPAVASSIVGVRTLAHLEGLERAADLVLDGEAMRRLNEIFDINHGRPLRPGEAPEAYSW